MIIIKLAESMLHCVLHLVSHPDNVLLGVDAAKERAVHPYMFINIVLRRSSLMFRSTVI